MTAPPNPRYQLEIFVVRLPLVSSKYTKLFTDQCIINYVKKHKIEHKEDISFNLPCATENFFYYKVAIDFLVMTGNIIAILLCQKLWFTTVL